MGLGLVVADLATKAIATTVPDWPLIEPRVNTELALGVLSTESPTPVLVFVLACVAFVLLDLARRSRQSLLAAWSLVLVIAGGVANAVDRAVTGGVHDWLHLGPIVANLADVWLLAGLVGYVAAAMKADRPVEVSTS